MSGEEYKLINERVGLVGAVGLLVGTAIGMSIFIVPTQMMAEAGPSITVAILISIVPMIFAVLGLLQLGGAIPVAGGAYVYSSRLVGPFFGMLGVTVPVLAIWAYLLFAALGFAEYLQFFAIEFAYVPELPRLAVVWVLLFAFLLLNYFGIRLVAKVQLAMVAALLIGLVTFVAFGAFDIETSNYTPLFPSEGVDAPFADGLTPFVIAIITLYIPFQGFTIIVEIGEELENPIQNIPRVLAIGMGLVTLVSVAVVFVVAGLLTWEAAPAVVESGGGLATVLSATAPTEAAMLVAIAALIGAATTINTLFTSYSRTIMRAARDDVLPSSFATIHEEYNTPLYAISLLGIPPLLLAPAVIYVDGLVAINALDWLVVVVVTGIFTVFTFLGIALWRLPSVFPKRYEHSFYKLPMPVLRVVAVGNIVVSLAFALLVAVGQLSAFVLVLVWLVLSYLGYRYRLYSYGDETELKNRMQSLDSHE